ncbi:hypothetical protein D3C71_1395010 [compost metagenome]
MSMPTEASETDVRRVTSLLGVNTVRVILRTLLNAGVITPSAAGAALAEIANKTTRDCFTDGERAFAAACAKSLGEVADSLDVEGNGRG